MLLCYYVYEQCTPLPIKSRKQLIGGIDASKYHTFGNWLKENINKYIVQRSYCQTAFCPFLPGFPWDLHPPAAEGLSRVLQWNHTMFLCVDHPFGQLESVIQMVSPPNLLYNPSLFTLSRWGRGGESCVGCASTAQQQQKSGCVISTVQPHTQNTAQCWGHYEES